MRAGFAGRRRHRKSHFPGAAVRQVANGIEPFARRAGGDQHVDPGQQTGIRRGLEQLFRLHGFPHAALADLPAGLGAGARPQDAHAPRDQRLHIGLGGLVRPHDPVHGGCEGDGSLGGDAHRGQQIVGPAARHAGDEVRAGRRHQHELRPAGEFDVAHGGLRRAIPQIAAHGSPRHRLKAQGGHESECPGRHHHLHLGAPFDEAAHQVRALVGGDAARDPQENSRLGYQWMPFNSLKRVMSLSNCLCMVDSSRRFCKRLSSCVWMSLRVRTRSSAT